MGELLTPTLALRLLVAQLLFECPVQSRGLELIPELYRMRWRFPYIVAVFVAVLAHVHLLCLDGRIAVRGRVYCGIWGSSAIKIILLVLHGRNYAVLMLRVLGFGD